MNEMRKLIEAIEEINEVSDFDGEALDDLIVHFQGVVESLGIANDPVKQRELTQVILARAKFGGGGLGHENVLGHEHTANFGGWPDKQR